MATEPGPLESLEGLDRREAAAEGVGEEEVGTSSRPVSPRKRSSARRSNKAQDDGAEGGEGRRALPPGGRATSSSKGLRRRGDGNMVLDEQDPM